MFIGNIESSRLQVGSNNIAKAYRGIGRVFPLPGYLDNFFISGFEDTFLSAVRSCETQPDGKILLGGFFDQYQGFSQNCLTRINIGGTRDTTFSVGTGFDDAVTSIKIQSDGKVLAAGSFTSYNGNTRNGIVRLNTNGGIDDTFNIGTGFNGFIGDIKIQSDGKILAVGSFSSYNGNTRNRLVRLNADGSIDNTFSIGTGLTASFSVIARVVEIQPDGKILVGGSFESYNSNARNRLVRINTDGSIDNTFSIGTGFNTEVNSIKTQPDGKILVGGAFTSYNGNTRNRLVRLNANGSMDNTFNIGTGFSGGSNRIFSTETQSDGKILVGGAFTSYNGDVRNNIIRLNTDGSIDNTFVMGVGFDNQVEEIIFIDTDRIMAGGAFTSYKSKNIELISMLYI